MENCQGCGGSFPSGSLTMVMDVRGNRIGQQLLCNSCSADFMRRNRAQGRYGLEIKGRGNPGQQKRWWQFWR